jgi:5'(3')-deoxyribonucleotidase
MKRPVIAIDIDETISPFIPIFVEYLNDKDGTNLSSSTFFSYKFDEVLGCSYDDCKVKVVSFFDSNYISKIHPFQGAYETLCRLKLDFELHVVTARSNNYSELTTNWIHKHFPNVFDHIHFCNHYSDTEISRNKSEICKAINAILLVDDNLEYALDCVENGIHAILFGNYAWNQSKLLNSNRNSEYKVIRAHSWYEVMGAIKKLCALDKIDIISNHLVMAAIQFCSTNSKDINLSKICRLIKLAKDRGASFICLPECWYFCI